jgi:hypothetical protein
MGELLVVDDLVVLVDHFEFLLLAISTYDS